MLNYKFDDEKGLISLNYEGKITVNEILENAYSDEYEEEERKYLNILIDIRFANIEEIQMDSFNLRELRARLDKSVKHNYILLVSSIEQLFSPFGHIVRDVFKSELRAFVSYDEAMDYVKKIGK
jgi:hypothetical protein